MNKISKNPTAPTEGNQRRYSISTWQFVCYLVFWISIFFLIPEDLIGIHWVKNYTGFIAKAIPSVKGYASASSAPNAALVFWSIQWSLVPIYYVLWSGYLLTNVEEAIRKSRGQTGAAPIWLLIFCLVFASAIVYLPQEIRTDPRTVHLPAQWERLMFEYQAVSGVMAVVVPIVFSILLVFIVGFFSYIFNSSEKN